MNWHHYILPAATGFGTYVVLYLTLWKKPFCKHDWFNMRVIETGENARICEKCFKMERHLP